MFLAFATANTVGESEDAAVGNKDHQQPVTPGNGGAVTAVSAIGGK